MNIQNSFQGHRKELGLSILLSLVLFGIVYFLFPAVINRSWLPALLIPFVMLGLHYREKLGNVMQALVFGIILAVALIFGYYYFQNVRSLIENPPVWDFQTFWLSGNVANRHLNFYEPQNFHNTSSLLGLKVDDEFSQEILDVGSLYPPVTMLLFVPLGWFNIKTAALIWFVFQTLILMVDIILIWKIFFSDGGINDFIFVTTIVLMFPPIINNIWLAQINLFVLLTLLLFWRSRKDMHSGGWLMVGIFMKPYVAIWFIYLLLKRQWKVFVGAIITALVLAVLSFVAFGSTTFFSYFVSNPANKLPSWYFSELGNGSLYALIWRLIPKVLGEGVTTLVQPVFLIVTIILFGLTIWAVYKLIPLNDDWALALLLSFGLFIYPNTGTNYCGVLLIPILLWWKNRDQITGGHWGILIFSTLECAFFGYHQGWSNFVIVGVGFAWIACLIVGLLLIFRKTPEKVLVQLQTLSASNAE